jgi:hypothetical protein
MELLNMFARRAADPFNGDLGRKDLDDARSTLAIHPRDQIGVGDDADDVPLAIYDHHPLVRRGDQQAENFLQGRRFLHGGNVAGHHVGYRGLSAGNARWLVCRGDAARWGLRVGQRPAVMLSFKDVHDNTYSVIDPPNFKDELFDLPLA